MKMIVGLGNPGPRYEGTRHNIGFDFIAELKKRNTTGSPKEKFRAEVSECVIAGEKTLLVQPLTFMNLSGEAVLGARDFYKIASGDWLVACDDFALPIGKLRLRAKGSSGGQKGLEDIIRRCGGDEFPRLRIGIGPLPERWAAADFVLGKFTKQEAATAADSIIRAAEAAETWIRDGLATAMNRFNV